jgi:phosphatidylserine decarboxylase
MKMNTITHQYIERDTGEIKNEKLFHDRLINAVYSSLREERSLLYKAVTSKRMSRLIAYMYYDLPGKKRVKRLESLWHELGIKKEECYDRPTSLDTARKIFERKIRYREFRPMTEEKHVIVSPADAKVIIGSLSDTSSFFIKEKFFSFDELLGKKDKWTDLFREGDYAIFRLTPEKYHYNHVPVDGIVEDIYEIDGVCNSCNPGAVLLIENAFSKNRRVVTIINTDVPGGTGAGRVAMIEVVALMIGGIKQCYSAKGYEKPKNIFPGMFLEKGQPKSLYIPGSSVDILIFEKNRIKFCHDLLSNSRRGDVKSRFSSHFGNPLVETDLKVRENIGESLIRRVK